MATIKATSLRAGSAILYQGKPFVISKYNLIKMGRGGATVRVNARNLENGASLELTFSSNLSFEELDLKKRKLQYLYKDAVNATFMDPRSYEQTEIPLSVLDGEILYIKEGEEINVLFWEERALSVEIPPKVVLAISQTDPGVKGNSATNIYKPAVAENGLSLKVPLFVNIGDKIVVDTRSGDYVERAK